MNTREVVILQAIEGMDVQTASGIDLTGHLHKKQTCVGAQIAFFGPGVAPPRGLRVKTLMAPKPAENIPRPRSFVPN